MAEFNYLAIDAKDKQVKGSIMAESLLEAKTLLRQQGLDIIWVRKESRHTERLGLSKVENLDLAVFAHQFSVMISSGIPLIRALKALGEETTNKSLRSAIDKIRFDVENGSSLSDALSKHPKIFSSFFISLVKTGEAAGILPKVLNRLAQHLEKTEDLKRKVYASLSYPIIVTFVAIGAVVFLLIFIVPVFVKAYKTIKAPLPGPTLTLIFLSNILIKFWWLLLILIGLAFFLFRAAQKNEKFALAFDAFKLRIPVFGELFRKVIVARFVRTLSTMIESGVNLSVSLDMTKEVVGNRLASRAIESVQRDIGEGKQISEALKTQGIFPAITVQMISVGEESGSLNAMLDKCAGFLEEDIDTLIKNMVVKLEPTLTILLAGLVAFIALSIYLPMFDLIRKVSR